MDGRELRTVVFDHTRMGDGTASGELKAAVLGGWPPEDLLHVFDSVDGTVDVATGNGEPAPDWSPGELIAAFDADLILYRPVPETPALHALAMDVIETSNLPLAIWIVDDWPTAFAQNNPAAAARLDADLRWLLARADVRFSISEEMSTAFEERYGHPFIPIANGIDPAEWPAARLRAAGHVTVRYAGNLTQNMTLATVHKVALAVERLAERGVPIDLEIRSRQAFRTDRPEWQGLAHTSATSSDLGIEEYRRWLTEADIVVLAYNFDAASRGYIRYSLANKLPECLASGAAVLAVGPRDVGTMALLQRLDVGERVTTDDIEEIEDALERLAGSPEARFEQARRAQAVAFERFNVVDVRKRFARAVEPFAAAHHTGEFGRPLHANVDETAIVASLLAERRGPDHVLLDVGAHTGSSAAHFNRLGWTIHAFEPNPEIRAALTKRFAGRANVHVDGRALGETAAPDAVLYDSPESTGITTLEPFHPSHRPGAHVAVTTLANVVRELHVEHVDFLKIDVEGLDLGVLRGAPWDDVQPDVIECEFEDHKTAARGHTWRDIAEFLRARGYTVYVSEWHPIIRYGIRHDWRRVIPFTDKLQIDADAWGNFVAFADDPGWQAVRRAFERNVELGTAKRTPRPAAAAARSNEDLQVVRRLRRFAGRVKRGVRRRLARPS